MWGSCDRKLEINTIGFQLVEILKIQSRVCLWQNLQCSYTLPASPWDPVEVRERELITNVSCWQHSHTHMHNAQVPIPSPPQLVSKHCHSASKYIVLPFVYGSVAWRQTRFPRLVPSATESGQFACSSSCYGSCSLHWTPGSCDMGAGHTTHEWGDAQCTCITKQTRYREDESQRHTPLPTLPRS